MRKDPLERFLDSACRAVSSKNSVAFMDLISNDYVDRYGLTRGNIEEMIRRLFLSFDDIKVIIPGKTTSREQKLAGNIILEFKVVATYISQPQAQPGVDLSVYGNQRYYLVGGPTETGSMTLSLRKEGKQWRLLSVEHIDIGRPIPHYAP